jgi:hypothetical protein
MFPSVKHPFALALTLLALGLASHGASAATPIVIKNHGSTTVRIGFDNGAPATIGPGDTMRVSLNSGQHSAQCRYDGEFDGCNLADSFALDAPKEVTFDLWPTLTLQHAVQLAQQGTLRVETRQGMIWATRARDVEGAGADCDDYSTGKLGAVSTRVRGSSTVGNLSPATQTLCGEQRVAIGAVVNGEQLYFHPRFLMFKDGSGHPILVRQ